MPFVILGVLLIVAHFLDIGPMGAWNWNLTGDLWKFAISFVFAAIWWAIADSTGHYQRREMRAMEEKRQKRREENMVSLGIDLRNRRAKRPGRGT